MLAIFEYTLYIRLIWRKENNIEPLEHDLDSRFFGFFLAYQRHHISHMTSSAGHRSPQYRRSVASVGSAFHAPQTRSLNHVIPPLEKPQV